MNAMKLHIDGPLVSTEWLLENLSASNLIILDATMGKITDSNTEISEKKQIKGASFFDIKHVFSDQNSSLPNTMLSEHEFEEKARNIGINNDSAIVVYDDLGIYSSPRVWWLFKSMGHANIAVLDGGLPSWKKANLPIENSKNSSMPKGNFKAKYQPQMMCNSDKVLEAISDTNKSIFDARSKGRFYGTESEPRKEIRSGHIPSSINVPFSSLQNEGKMLSEKQLTTLFNKLSVDNEETIFSCGSGITACILALGAEISGIKNLVVYDGSWTDWGGNHALPIQKK